MPAAYHVACDLRMRCPALGPVRRRLPDADPDPDADADRAALPPLQVRIGRPEEVLPELARQLGAGSVYCHSEVSHEDSQVEAAVRRALDGAGAELRPCWGGTLYHLDDLPFPLHGMPSSYGGFREKIGRLAVRPTSQLPPQLKALPLDASALEAGALPTMTDLGFQPNCLAERRQGQRGGVLGGDLRGGETEALRHLRTFLGQMKNTAGGGPQAAAEAAGGAGTGGASTSSRFSCEISPWLAMGCLSPRYMYQSLVGGWGECCCCWLGPRLSTRWSNSCY